MKKKTFSIIATLLLAAQGVWAQETETPTWSGSGTSDDPYLIQSVADWNKLAEGSQTNSYAGVYFKQTFNNIGVAKTMVGSAAHPFAGIYDGGGNTITFNLAYHDFNDESKINYFVAPFQYIKGATIKHLCISNSSDIKGDLHVSGLVGSTVNENDNNAQPPINIIEDCRVSADIWCYETHAAGFIGHGEKANNILKGCIFDGTIRSMYSGSDKTYAAPFIGWCEYAADDRSTLQGCFEKGTYTGHTNTGFTNTALYFVNGTDKTKGVTVYRTFHSQPWNDGHHGYTVTSGTDGLSLKFAFEKYHEFNPYNVKCTVYSTSGITYYDAGSVENDTYYDEVGIIYDNKLYAAKGDKVVFYPQSASNNYSYTNFTTSSGVVTENENLSCTLVMDADNSVITGGPYVTLYDEGKQNLTKLDETNEMTSGTVELRNRTLSKNGMWNTLCLPFTLTVANSPLAGATIKTLDGASLSEDGMLTLNFSENSPTTITAGTPFIVKWENAEDTKLQNPVFSNVTISNTLNDVVISGVLTFKGIFSPYAISGEDKTMLYLDTDNKLCYPNDAMTIGACRAYFQLADGITAGEPASAGAKSISHIVLNFDNGVVTGITNTDFTDGTDETGAWYDLSGRRLTSKPTQKGIYINNGIKVVIK